VLAEETEILFAERRAEWLPDLEAYEQRLTNVSPHDLYTTCLETLRQKHEHVQHLTEETHQLIRFIEDEIHALKVQELWPNKVPTLAEVL
jgi:SNF2 family DNA or RNA helicase